MKKFMQVFAVIAALCMLATPALALDKIMNDKIQSATVAIDKNGNKYIRLIVQEERKLQGTSYTIGVPVMVFGNLVEPAKALKAGDTLKAVVASREYQGNTSYTVRAFLK